MSLSAGQLTDMSAELTSWFTSIDRTAARVPPPGVFTNAPDPATTIVVRVEEGGRREVFAAGARTRAAYGTDPYERPVSCLQLRLLPGASRALLGVSAAELVGRAVPVGALPGRVGRVIARELTGEMGSAEADRVVHRLAELLPTPADGPRERLLRAGVEALSAGRSASSVQEVAARLAVSERQLRNLFTDGVGLSPKHYARIERVRHVLARADTMPWAELAVTGGYYDQSHMTADFRALMGVPPRAFVTGRLPEPTPCRGGIRG